MKIREQAKPVFDHINAIQNPLLLLGSIRQMRAKNR
jgi:hypothetical protein